MKISKETMNFIVLALVLTVNVILVCFIILNYYLPKDGLIYRGLTLSIYVAIITNTIGLLYKGKRG